MTTLTLVATESLTEQMHQRLIVAGLAGAVALTLGWWAVLAGGLWMAIG